MPKAINLELERDLRILNDQWKEITEKRKAWMDAHMPDFAEYPVGAELYDLETGRRLGVVTEHYRYHASDPRFDRSMDIQYRFDNGDNTSHYGFIMIGDHAALIRHRKAELARMERAVAR